MASEIDATVEVEKDGNRVCGTSIMGLMMLGAAMGDSITIHVEGQDADGALERLVKLVECGFGEECG
jgi:phosphocarrier protein